MPELIGSNRPAWPIRRITIEGVWPHTDAELLELVDSKLHDGALCACHGNDTRIWYVATVEPATEEAEQRV